jgi:hypothetical protein
MNQVLAECPHLSIPSFYDYQYHGNNQFSEQNEYITIDDDHCIADEIFEIHLLGSILIPSKPNSKNKTRKKRRL